MFGAGVSIGAHRVPEIGNIMHSFFNFHNPQLQSLLWVQVIGMPIAFLVRAVILIVRAIREPANRHKHALRAVSNVLFAVSCWIFSVYKALAVICFAIGIGLSTWAFMIARAQAIRNAPPPRHGSKIPVASKANRIPGSARLRRNS
jgi:uncharacterized paraquat-inducible protein A